MTLVAILVLLVILVLAIPVAGMWKLLRSDRAVAIRVSVVQPQFEV